MKTTGMQPSSSTGGQQQIPSGGEQRPYDAPNIGYDEQKHSQPKEDATDMDDQVMMPEQFMCVDEGSPQPPDSMILDKDKLDKQQRLAKMMLPGGGKAADGAGGDAVWGGELGLGGGGNPLMYQGGIRQGNENDFPSNSKQWVNAVKNPRRGCRAICTEDEGAIAFGALRQLSILVLAGLIGFVALVFSTDDTTKRWESGDVAIYNILAYIAFIW